MKKRAKLSCFAGYLPPARKWMKRTAGVSAAFPTAGRCPTGWPVCPKGETIVASDITLAVGDGARRLCGLSAALVIILALAETSAHAGQAPREPYSCRLYADAVGRCALLNCSDRGNDRRLHRLKRECLRDGGGQP